MSQARVAVKAARRWTGYPRQYLAATLPAARLRVALVSDNIVYTSEQQFSPLIAGRGTLRRQLGLSVTRLRLADVLLSPKVFLAPFDAVFLKIAFSAPVREAMDAVNAIRAAVGSRKLVYFDGDDDVCVLWPQLLPLVDLYVKKHAFRDRSQYLKQWIGKSNLTDYVHHRFGVSFAGDPVAPTSGPVPVQELGKLLIGWNLALDDKIVQLHDSLSKLPPREKDCDIVCRASIPAGDWIQHLRQTIQPGMMELAGKYKVIAPTQRVAPDVYLDEMRSSRICVSPFGYGEICWRDFEAVLCGCLLVKPDMGHVETCPDIFRPYETYIPVRWDFSDLAEKCDYYLRHTDELTRIASRARAVLDDFYGQTQFHGRIGMVLQQLNLHPAGDRPS